MKQQLAGQGQVCATETRRGTGKVALATIAIIAGAAFWLALAAVADARAPVLLSVGQQDRKATARWSLPPSVGARVLEIAKQDPARPPGDGARVTSEGYFLQRNLITIEVLMANDTSITSTKVLSPGTYYIHVAGEDVKYRSCPLREWSDTFELTITDTGGLGGPNVAAGSPACPASSSGSGGGGGGGTGGGGHVGADVVAPLQRLTFRPIQRVDKLFVLAVMNEPGTFTVTGTVNIPGAAKVYRFKPLKRTVKANLRTKLRPKLAKRGLRAVKRALKRGKRLKAKLKITARDKAGNKRSQAAVVRLKP